VLINEEPFIHQLDLRKTVIPLLSRQRQRLGQTGRVVAIDPGHGGYDSGTRSVLTGEHEKEFTLDWALRLKALLTRYGYEPILTHATDQDISISNRVAAVEEGKAAVFVSLHFNASGSGEDQAGVETYCLTPAGMTSSMTRGYDDDPAVVFPNNAFDSENLLLACTVHSRLMRLSGIRDRGVRRARFLSVLRGQNRPAVLIEGGYLSNPAEARLIQSPEYRQQLAEALALALREYLGNAEQ
jgi:N-acetylmuramoyl-L-alanine amidase